MDILQTPGFSVVQSAKANYLCVQCDDEDQIDSIALQVLLEDCPPFLMPIQLRTMNDHRTFNFRLASGIALKHSLDTELSKNEYLKLVASLIAPFLTCREWFLDYHNICIDTQFILRDKQSGAYLFVYIPDNSYGNTDEDIIDFFRSVLNRIDITDNAVFQNRMMRYLMSSDVSLYELNDVIKRELESSNSGIDKGRAQAVQSQTKEIPTVQPQSQAPAREPQPEKPSTVETVTIKAAQSSDNTAAPKSSVKSSPAKAVKPEQHKNQKQGIFDFLLGKKKDDPFEELTGSVSSSQPAASDDIDELFGTKPTKKNDAKKASPFASARSAAERVKPLKQPTDSQPERKPAQSAAKADPIVPDVQVDTGYVGSEETNIGGGFEAVNELRLIDSKFEGAPDVISLDFKGDRAVIGRKNSETQPDIEFPISCKGVGRRHACITRKADGGYVISDLGSTYGTLLDGQRLVPNLEYELKDGMTLVLVEQKSIRYRVVIADANDLL